MPPTTSPATPRLTRACAKLAAGADVLIYDAQYLPEEYQARKRGWGHSHWREAVNVAMESGAKELILYHHDPDHDDACIDKVVKEARNYYPRVRAAAEGMEIEALALSSGSSIRKRGPATCSITRLRQPTRWSARSLPSRCLHHILLRSPPLPRLA